MGPEYDLPIPSGYNDERQYVEELISTFHSTPLLNLLCGGVHILDFFTRTPYLYAWLLPEEWRAWFEYHDLVDLLDLFLREDLSHFKQHSQQGERWRTKPPPPSSLISYLFKIRSLSLRRDFSSASSNKKLNESTSGHVKRTIPRHVAVGMKDKKMHEVDHFVRFVHKLIIDAEQYTGRKITHVVDFGSGQNYLGRTLASPPYNMHVIAVESRHANVEGAKAMDVHAKLAPKTGIRRNKKIWRAQQQEVLAGSGKDVAEPIGAISLMQNGVSEEGSEGPAVVSCPNSNDAPVDERSSSENGTHVASFQRSPDGGSIQYVEHRLEDGNLDSVIDETINPNRSRYVGSGENTCDPAPNFEPPNLMIISLHSCGNLTHHGLRSLTLNQSVSGVALVGCCYNLVTERLNAPSYKLPNLRPQLAISEPSRHPPYPYSSEIDTEPAINSDTGNTETATKSAHGDPHGFPMSKIITESGISLNITARMMAVQAPFSWKEEDSNRFFTRHFYRALLQKIFVDRGVVKGPSDSADMSEAEIYASFVSGAESNVAASGSEVGPTDDTGVDNGMSGNWSERGGATQPVIIGSLRKSCYASFVAYVRGAVEKLASSGSGPVGSANHRIGALVREKMMNMSEEDIQAYEIAYSPRRKDLSIVWTLMALSATLVEALIVVDRWLWLKEQMPSPGYGHDEGNPMFRESSGGGGSDDAARVRRAWVESVFDYSRSPRNLAIIGIKK